MKLEKLISPFSLVFGATRDLWAKADVAAANRNLAGAEAIYRRLSKRRPKDAEGYQYSALSHYRLNKPADALGILEAGLRKHPEASRHYLLNHYVRISSEMQNIEQAIRFIQADAAENAHVCEMLLDMRFDESHIRSNLLEFCLQQGYIDLALQGSTSIEGGFDTLMILWKLGDLLLQQGRVEDAEAVYRKISSRERKTQEDYYYAGLAECRLKNQTGSFAIFESALDELPVSRSGYLFEQYIRLAGELNEIERAARFVLSINFSSEVQICEMLFAMEFVGSYVRINVFEYCLKHRLDALAQRALESITTSFSDFETLWRLADILGKHGRGGDAKDIFRLISAGKPETALDYHYSAISDYRLNNPDASIVKYEESLRRFPEAISSFLFENYFAIAVEIGVLERVIDFMQTLNGLSEDEAYQLLFNLHIANAHIRIALINYCIKRGMDERAAAGIEFVFKKHDDIVSQWMLVDLLQKYGRVTEAEAIYKNLAERTPNSADDYYYASAAQLRLGRTERCLDIIEQGQRLYPDAELLSTLYVQICATNLDFDRYARFKQETCDDQKAATSKLEFYKLAIRNGAAEAFILNYKEIEANFDAASFSDLKNDFLSMLEENPPSFDRAKIILFFSRYLDADSAFTVLLFKVLQHAKAASGDVESVRHTLQLLYSLTPPMIPHFSADPRSVADRFILNCFALSEDTVELREPMEDMTNNWTPWQYIFCLAVPDMYHKALRAFEKIIFASWPKLQFTSPHVSERLATAASPGRKIRIGFTVHDSMPMMSGLMAHLDRNMFETVYLRPGQQSTSAAGKDWIARAGETVEYSDTDSYAAIEKIAEQKLDIIVSGPAIAAIFYPMMARLAPLQMVLLEPNWTDGLTNSDYYISWQLAEPKRPSDFYQSAVAFLEHPPYWIERPSSQGDAALSEEKRNEIRQRVLGCGAESRVYLCANTLPKIHPRMDDIFYELLDRDPSANLVLLRGDYPPGKSLKARLKERLGRHYDRVKFLKTLNKDDAHSLLQAVDCSLDSYPLCGMSSSFDGFMLGVPIVTLPSNIPFGNWTASIYEYMGVTGLTAQDVHEYVEIAMRLASDREWREQKSMEVRQKSSRYVESKESADEFQEFIIQAWERKRAGLPIANWLSGAWK